MTIHYVKDGVRTLEVRGSLLAESSSEEAHKDRWIEFQLYKTSAKSVYVVSRIGKSRLYHDKDCKTVTRNRLSAVDPQELPLLKMKACPTCNPSLMDTEGVFPEIPRPHVQVCDSAEGVVSFLTQRDDDGTYLTNVARDLLEQSSEVDDDIYDVYMNGVIL